MNDMSKDYKVAAVGGRSYDLLSFTTLNVDGEERPWNFKSVSELKELFFAEDYDGPDGEDKVLNLTLNGTKLCVTTFDDLVNLLGIEHDIAPTDELMDDIIIVIVSSDGYSDGTTSKVLSGNDLEILLEDAYNTYCEDFKSYGFMEVDHNGNPMLSYQDFAKELRQHKYVYFQAYGCWMQYELKRIQRKQPGNTRFNKSGVEEDDTEKDESEDDNGISLFSPSILSRMSTAKDELEYSKLPNFNAVLQTTDHRLGCVRRVITEILTIRELLYAMSYIRNGFKPIDEMDLDARYFMDHAMHDESYDAVEFIQLVHRVHDEALSALKSLYKDYQAKYNADIPLNQFVTKVNIEIVINWELICTTPEEESENPVIVDLMLDWLFQTPLDEQEKATWKLPGHEIYSFSMNCFGNYQVIFRSQEDMAHFVEWYCICGDLEKWTITTPTECKITLLDHFG